MAEASSLVETLDQKFLECGICLQRFQRPRGLPCLHSFCHECLETLCEGKKEVLCPNCKRFTKVPDEGVSGFPADFIVNSLQETVDMENLKIKHENSVASSSCGNCKKSGSRVTVRCLDCNLLFCKSCHQAHDILEPMRAHQVITLEDQKTEKTVIPVSMISNDQTCEAHDGEPKAFYCQMCRKSLCGECLLMKQGCKEHIDNVTSLKKASLKQRAKLMELTKQCEAFKTSCQSALQTIQVVTKDFETALLKGKQKLAKIKTGYRKQLEETFQTYDSAFQSEEDARLAEFRLMAGNIQTMLTECDSVCNLSSDIIQNGSDYDIISNYSTLSTTLEDLSETAIPERPDETMAHLQVKIQTKIVFPELALTKGDENHSTLALPQHTNPNTKMSGLNNSTQSPTQNTNAATQTSDLNLDLTNSQPPTQNPNSATQKPDLNLDLRNNCIQCQTYNTNSASQTSNSNLVSNEAWMQIKQFDTSPKLKHPQGIAVTVNGNIALTNYHKYAGVVTENRDLVFTFRGDFTEYLYDIAVMPDGNFILPGSNRIDFFDSSGLYIVTDNSTTTSHRGKPSFVKTLAVDTKGRIIVGLLLNTISIHSSDGRALQKFAVSLEPRYLAPTPNEELVVSFEGTILKMIKKGELKIMNYKGEHVRKMKPKDINDWNPVGVCCSTQGNIFVANNGDTDPAGIYQFSADGSQCLGCVITGLHDPRGIAISADGQQLYVTERHISLVKIFRRGLPLQP